MYENKDEVKWPSERVPKGGIFNLPKVEYSKETHDFLNLLMEEQKLSIMQRNKINNMLRTGQPFPISKPKRKPVIDCFPMPDLMRMKNARRRTLDAIKASGGYDRAKYIPKTFEPAELKKIRLQEKMSGLKHQFSIENKTKLPKASSQQNDEIEPIDELLHEIQERMDWLEEMEKLGEGHTYKPLIKSEIEERLRLIKRLQSSSNEKQ